MNEPPPENRLATRRRIAIALTALAGLAVAGWTAGLLWDESQEACGLASVLSHDASQALSELDGAHDPFTRFALLKRFVPQRIVLERELAAGIASRFCRFHVPSEKREDARALLNWRDSDGIETWSQLLHGLAQTNDRGLRCPSPDAELARADTLHAVALDYLGRDAANDAREYEHEWNVDQATYCRSRVGLARLERIRDAQADACKNLSPQYTQGCRPEATASLRSEIEQLGEVDKINEKKLLAKWGRELYARIRCD